MVDYRGRAATIAQLRKWLWVFCFKPMASFYSQPGRLAKPMPGIGSFPAEKSKLVKPWHKP
jgi:hypothetical protein